MRRVTTSMTKVGFVLVVFLVAFLLGVTVGAGFGLEALAAPTALTAWAAGVVVMTRVFRGPTEAVDPPRAWWRATATPGVGIAVAALFTAGAVSALLAPGEAALTRAYDAALSLLLAAFFAHSSWRLRSGDAGGTEPAA